jgi:hypothetical protein
MRNSETKTEKVLYLGYTAQVMVRKGAKRHSSLIGYMNHKDNSETRVTRPLLLICNM